MSNAWQKKFVFILYARRIVYKCMGGGVCLHDRGSVHILHGMTHKEIV